MYVCITTIIMVMMVVVMVIIVMMMTLDDNGVDSHNGCCDYKIINNIIQMIIFLASFSRLQVHNKN
jgi:hypothetical protein